MNADSFSGLRALLIPSDKKRQLAARRRRIALFGLEDAGRWSLIRKGRQAAQRRRRRWSRWPKSCCAAMAWCSARLLEREADWLPPWHALLRVFRRLEAQGKIRGGRFVAGMSGEQYALPDAVSAMRAIRRQEARGDFVSLSAADPLNLTGIITPGARVPALTNNRVLYRDGVPVAIHAAGQSDFLVEMEPGKEWEARQALLQKNHHAGVGTRNLRVVRGLVITACVVMLTSVAGAAGRLVVHEWGTITTIHEAAGTARTGLNRIDESEVLPDFVHRFEPETTRHDPKRMLGKSPQVPGPAGRDHATRNAGHLFPSAAECEVRAADRRPREVSRRRDQ